ncbi:hypothetical protein SAMN04488023_108108 [Pedobacter rhizosphaerae]|uniref:Uncharacterized protein n=1 Tax=Pedobacter rhizosphaerae TaxID=390241 RepID=A0A1H9NU31_9SPHI|nr:hypothetical protein SAMN04488023_108108 [Pedobacter rhizosphaerae]
MYVSGCFVNLILRQKKTASFGGGFGFVYFVLYATVSTFLLENDNNNVANNVCVKIHALD